jgi:hypothetical protein
MSNHDNEMGDQMPLQDVEHGAADPSRLMDLPAELRYEIEVSVGNQEPWRYILTPRMKSKTKSSCSHQTHIAQLQSYQRHFLSVGQVESIP